MEKCAIMVKQMIFKVKWYVFADGYGKRHTDSSESDF